MKKVFKVIGVFALISIVAGLAYYYKTVVIPWTTMPETNAALLEEQYRQIEKEIQKESDFPPDDRKAYTDLVVKLRKIENKKYRIWLDSEDIIPQAIIDYAACREDVQTLFDEYLPKFGDPIRFSYDHSFSKVIAPEDEFYPSISFFYFLGSMMGKEIITLVNEGKTNQAANLLFAFINIMDGLYFLPQLFGGTVTPGTEPLLIRVLLYVLYEIPNPALNQLVKKIQKMPDPKAQYIKSIYSVMLERESYLDHLMPHLTLLKNIRSSFSCPFWYGPKYLSREKAWSQQHLLNVVSQISEKLNVAKSAEVIHEKTSPYVVFSDGGKLLHDFDKDAYRPIRAHLLRAGVLQAIAQELRRRKGQPFKNIIPCGENQKITFEGGRWHYIKTKKDS